MRASLRIWRPLKGILYRYGATTPTQVDTTIELVEQALEEAFQEGWEQGFDDAGHLEAPLADFTPSPLGPQELHSGR